eukprot:scaffold3641_cov175-Prasinococcus_capsulatus_cf.AAC.1
MVRGALSGPGDRPPPPPALGSSAAVQRRPAPGPDRRPVRSALRVRVRVHGGRSDYRVRAIALTL